MSDTAQVVMITTPPNSSTSPPLTPPLSTEKGPGEPTSRILSAGHAYKLGHSLFPWHSFRVEKYEFGDLLVEVV
ncbi:uncharacterized protein BP5553_06110 [Venustampulla echinocandica]|uniref:Uncharacterized protein n=1 Tax=Venustampulla echinocandica TaxID=2656787 RepID=A0A370TMM5_9HELO|nr:uncharacterized protein BP5553_06110 [Venustampulla echinocandica]RDL36758.1 hypothetical protein BP5553_06110 [Venustampulla echinocandica]